MRSGWRAINNVSYVAARQSIRGNDTVRHQDTQALLNDKNCLRKGVAVNVHYGECPYNKRQWNMH